MVELKRGSVSEGIGDVRVDHSGPREERLFFFFVAMASSPFLCELLRFRLLLLCRVALQRRVMSDPWRQKRRSGAAGGLSMDFSD